MTQEEIMRTWQEHLTEQAQERRETEATEAAAQRAALKLIKREKPPALMSYEEIAVNAFYLYRLELALIHGGGRKGKIKTAARKKAIKIIARTPASAAAGATAAALDSLTELAAIIQRTHEEERLENYPLAYKPAARLQDKNTGEVKL